MRFHTEEIVEDGVVWPGNRDQLEEWKRVKKDVALAFVRRGLSVEWSPDASRWLAVFVPEQTAIGRPEVRARIVVAADPTIASLEDTRIIQLSIDVVRSEVMRHRIGRWTERMENFFRFEHGEVAVQRMDQEPWVKTLHEAIVQEFSRLANTTIEASGAVGSSINEERGEGR